MVSVVPICTSWPVPSRRVAPMSSSARRVRLPRVTFLMCRQPYSSVLNAKMSSARPITTKCHMGGTSGACTMSARTEPNVVSTSASYAPFCRSRSSSLFTASSSAVLASLTANAYSCGKYVWPSTTYLSRCATLATYSRTARSNTSASAAAASICSRAWFTLSASSGSRRPSCRKNVTPGELRTVTTVRSTRSDGERMPLLTVASVSVDENVPANTPTMVTPTAIHAMANVRPHLVSATVSP
mmetsp:Transcript_36762/g.89973  ORF Transcript_36762/g.89973 Transcript_36762/m.89973 type:complete len:242 (+) Transcript_36762:268-993(+)